jgi:hypothetical protein
MLYDPVNSSLAIDLSSIIQTHIRLKNRLEGRHSGLDRYVPKCCVCLDVEHVERCDPEAALF